MDPVTGTIVAGGIEGGAQFLGSLGSSAAGLSKLKSKRWRRDQDWYFGRQYKDWVDKFNYEAEYNSPLNQKKRLIEAGLNPNLMYGETASTGNVAMGASDGVGSVPSLGYDSAVVAGGIERAVQSQANLRYLNSMTNKNDAETNRINEQTPLLNQVIRSEIAKFNTDVKLALQQFDFFENTKETQANILKGKNQFLIVQNAKSSYELKHILPSTSRYISNMADSFYWRAKTLETEFNMAPLKAAQIVAQTNLFCSQAYKAYEEGRIVRDLSEAQIKSYTAQANYYNELPTLTREGYTNAFDIAVLNNDTNRRGQNIGGASSLFNGLTFLLLGRSFKGFFNKKPPTIGFKGAIRSSALGIGIGTFLDFLNGVPYNPNNKLHQNVNFVNSELLPDTDGTI